MAYEIVRASVITGERPVISCRKRVEQYDDIKNFLIFLKESFEDLEFQSDSVVRNIELRKQVDIVESVPVYKITDMLVMWMFYDVTDVLPMPVTINI